MDSSSELTVCFEDPFWVGIYERTTGKKLEAAKFVFGAEPKDCEVYDWFLKNGNRLRFSPPVKNNLSVRRAVNPKRMQREIERRLAAPGTGTKARQALKLLQEQDARERKTRSREREEAEEERRYELRRQKQKRKHRGR
jgi:hypothetical protein